MNKINFKKYADGLVPVIVQDFYTRTVLMLGFMNEEAFNKTIQISKVTFFSRSKNRLWTKGEESGNILNVKQVLFDCDTDTILIKAVPAGPVCHTGVDTCFAEDNSSPYFLYDLESIISQRRISGDAESYTNGLFKKGINTIAQKVGEEAVELIIEAKDENAGLFKNEAADLMYHFLVLLQAKNTTLAEIEEILVSRHGKKEL